MFFVNASVFTHPDTDSGHIIGGSTEGQIRNARIELKITAVGRQLVGGGKVPATDFARRVGKFENDVLRRFGVPTPNTVDPGLKFAAPVSKFAGRIDIEGGVILIDARSTGIIDLYSDRYPRQAGAFGIGGDFNGQQVVGHDRRSRCVDRAGERLSRSRDRPRGHLGVI